MTDDIKDPVIEATEQQIKRFNKRDDFFTKILKEARDQGIYPARTIKAREWFRNKALSTFTSSSNFRSRAPLERRRQGIQVGTMYFFAYDAKTKDDLPYWDKFPLIFPIEYKDGGFLGINLHYLPPNLRAKLMDALYTISTDRRYNRDTKLNIAYRTLVAATKFKWFKPCVKRYLFSHVKSDFFRIESYEWDMAVMVPWQNFQKASQYQVWSDSERIIRGTKAVTKAIKIKKKRRR